MDKIRDFLLKNFLAVINLIVLIVICCLMIFSCVELVKLNENLQNLKYSFDSLESNLINK